MKYATSCVLIFWLLALLQSCAGIVPTIEEPKVSVTSVTLDKKLTKPGFNTSLNITNPNNFPLNVTGLYYELEVNGYEIANGTSNEAMNIAAYGDIDTSFYTKIDLFESFSLINALTMQGAKTPTYKLKAKLQVNGFPIPLTITKEGDIAVN